MSFSGLIVGLVKGWKLALCILVAAPALTLVGALFARVMQTGIQKNMLAYSQSAGYAEQALSAIRVVSAFGMESLEAKNYTKYLERAKNAGFRNQLWSAVCLGLFFLVVYSTYAYSFWIGSIFVEKQVWNKAVDRPYTGGDLLSCFFGVIIGLFSLAQSTNHFKAV